MTKQIPSVNPLFETVLAKDLGYKLPIGILKGDKFCRDFSMTDLTPEIERKVGKFRNDNDGSPQTAVVSKLVSLLLTSVGGSEFGPKADGSKMSDEERHLQVRQMYMADVYYLYLMARMRELGNDYAFTYFCPSCKLAKRIVCDLSTMEVVCATSPASLRTEVELRFGMKYRDGTVKKKVTVTPAFWFHVEGPEMLEMGADSILVRLHLVSKCITGVEGNRDAIVLTTEEVNSLRKIDVELASKAIADMNVGPSLVIEGKCPGRIGVPCNREFISVVDWNYNDFFSISSLS